jgi:hypothetical protein
MSDVTIDPHRNDFGTQDVSKFGDREWVEFLTHCMRLDKTMDNPVTRAKLARHKANIANGVQRRT